MFIVSFWLVIQSSMLPKSPKKKKKSRQKLATVNELHKLCCSSKIVEKYFFVEFKQTYVIKHCQFVVYQKSKPK